MDKMGVLEEKIRKATDLIRSLREDRNIVEDRLTNARDEIKRLSLRETEDPQLRGKLDQMAIERRDTTERVERMITIMNTEDCKKHIARSPSAALI